MRILNVPEEFFEKVYRKEKIFGLTKKEYDMMEGTFAYEYDQLQLECPEVTPAHNFMSAELRKLKKHEYTINYDDIEIHAGLLKGLKIEGTSLLKDFKIKTIKKFTEIINDRFEVLWKKYPHLYSFIYHNYHLFFVNIYAVNTCREIK